MQMTPMSSFVGTGPIRDECIMPMEQAVQNRAVMASAAPMPATQPQVPTKTSDTRRSKKKEMDAREYERKREGKAEREAAELIRVARAEITSKLSSGHLWEHIINDIINDIQQVLLERAEKSTTASRAVQKFLDLVPSHLPELSQADCAAVFLTDVKKILQDPSSHFVMTKVADVFLGPKGRPAMDQKAAFFVHSISSQLQGSVLELACNQYVINGKVVAPGIPFLKYIAQRYREVHGLHGLVEEALLEENLRILIIHNQGNYFVRAILEAGLAVHIEKVAQVFLKDFTRYAPPKAKRESDFGVYVLELLLKPETIYSLEYKRALAISTDKSQGKVSDMARQYSKKILREEGGEAAQYQ